MHFFSRGWAVGFVLGVASTVCAAPSSETKQTLDRYLAQAVDASDPGVAIIATVNGKTIFRDARGVGSVKSAKKLGVKDSFRIGGLSNQFTATAILLLAEQGKLNVSDPVRKHLPSLPESAAAVTLEHLLTHTSGLNDPLSEPREAKTAVAVVSRAPNRNASPPWLRDLASATPPGSRFQYNETGYALLELVMEQVTRKPYSLHMAEALFRRFGLKDTTVESPDRTAKRTVAGHVRQGSGYEIAKPDALKVRGGASIVTTVDDLAKWHEALSNVRVLKADSMQKLFAPYKLPNGQSARYGYGWGLEPFNGIASFQHSGSVDGFSAFAMGVPEAGLFVAVLSNNAARQRASMVLAQRTAAALMGSPFPDSRPVTLSIEEMDRHVGIYKLEDGNDRLIYRDGDVLYLQRPGGMRQALTPATSHEFFDNDTLTYLRFEPDLRGVTAAVEIRLAMGTQKAARTSAIPPTIKTVQPMTLSQFASYAGRYQLTPAATLEVFESGGRFYMQPSREERVEIFPEREDLFFIKAFEANLEFVRDAREQVYEVVLKLPGGEMRAPRVQ